MSRLAPSLSREGLPWKAYALVALALTVVYFLLGGHPNLQTAIYQLFILAAPAAILVGVRLYRPDPRRHWLLFAGGLALWGIGDVYWDSYFWILGQEAPYPSFADVAYLSGYPLLIAGVFVLVRGWGRPRIGNLLDTVLVALAAGILSTLFLLKPMLSTSEPLFAKLISVGFPVLDFVMLVALTQLMFRRRVMNFALRAITVGTAAVLVADAVYSRLGLEGTYTSGMFIDAGWLACYALWGIAALHPSMAAIKSLHEQEGAGLSAWRIGALLLALLAAPLVLIEQTLAGQTIETGEIGTVIVATMLLVAARVWLLQRESKKAQAALAQSEERFRLAQTVSGVGTWDLDLTTKEVALTEHLGRLIMGSRSLPASYEAFIEFVHPDDRERIREHLTEAVEVGPDFEHEFRFRQPDGTEGWMFSRGRVLRDQDGAPTRALGVAIDITGRHEIDEELKQSAERFRVAESAGNVGSWDLDLTTGGLAWSDSLRRLIGVPPEFEPTYEAFLDWVHPDDRAGVDRAVSASLEGGTDFEIQYRYRRRDGVEGWMEARGRGLVDAVGTPIRSVGVAVDITRRHAMEQQLERSEERLQLAQELGGVGSWDANLETDKTTWSKNLRRISGVGDETEASRESFIALVHPDDRAGFEAAMVAAVDDGGHVELEHRLVRPNDGELRWMLTRGDAVTGPDGRSIRFAGVVVDITERRVAEVHRTKLEHQLLEAHKLEAVGRLAGGIAHDFNNILLAIRGNGELALDALKQGDNAVEEVEEMVAAADRAAALTMQLLAFSRRQVLQAETLDLNDVVQDMDKLLRRMIGDDVELHAVMGDEPVHISADRSQIEQVIANLAVNARDAMPEGGLLTLEVATTEIASEHGIDLPSGRYAKLTVNDTGHGMDPETVAKVFEPFFTTKADGTGFGLSTVHGIIVQSGGSIWVYSEVDQGTTFKIFLPLAEQAQPRESSLPEGLPTVAESTGETILLVEDDPHVQRIVCNILRRSGYYVLAAGGAEEALRLATGEDGTIHLLLSDLVMPGTSGRELAEQIQAVRPDISILYMSGYTDDAVVRRGVLEAGMAFIQKPFGADDLGRRIREVLDARDGQPVAA